MKKLTLIILAIAWAVAALAWKPTFIGHRGCFTGVMNTAEAFANGVEIYGYEGLECDVRVTADGQYIISHDETTNAVGGNLTVAQATLAQLQAEEYVQKRGDSTYTSHICTVAHYLDICKAKDVIPVVELKWATGINNNDMSNFDGLARLIDEKGLTRKVIILTSMRNSLEYIRTHYPRLRCQFLCRDNWATHFDWIVMWRLTPSIQNGCFDEETVRRFHEEGLGVAVWTVNNPDDCARLTAMGVDMLTSDRLVPADMPDLEPASRLETP